MEYKTHCCPNCKSKDIVVVDQDIMGVGLFEVYCEDCPLCVSDCLHNISDVGELVSIWNNLPRNCDCHKGDKINAL